METGVKKPLKIEVKPSRKVYGLNKNVALDEPTCIFINGEYHVTLIATPSMKKELVLGFLLSDGIIKSLEDVKTISINGDNVHVELGSEVDLRESSVNIMNLIVTACTANPRKTTRKVLLPKVESDLCVEADMVTEMVFELNRRTIIHQGTRGTHAAMVCSERGEVVAFSEDVGRHNAIDKVIGSMAMKGINPEKCVLISTGRLAGEMVQKSAMGGIPIIVSIAAPLASGIRLAEMTGVTMICFATGRQLEVYSNPHRIKT